ncbi:hypothetical protein [Sporosarcina sp. OR05]|uniref:hypothetical protein n=1 Tax=Sporosarcina sp. OR05 TaxID=2969819 RepID=UPI00352B6AF6
MKKRLALFCGALLLAGCANDKAEEQVKPDSALESNEQAESPSKDVETNTSADHVADLTDYEEYDVLSSEIDVDAYIASVVEDNEGKRVILFSNEVGEKIYKSIFVKHDQRLKIIDLHDDGLLFNDTINE